MADPPMSHPRLRLALTLPGAVSLGAYHGGAMAALLTAAQAADGQLVIDALATASAGSLTGVLAARALIRGADPVELMTKAWVEADSLSALRSAGHQSVLDPEPLRALAGDLLSTWGSVPDGDDTVARQADPVRISMALASLGGLAYRVPSLDADQPWFDAVTHLDWWNHTFRRDDGDQAFASSIAPALASAATALGFPPVRLDRSPDRATYETNHILAPPIRPGRPLEDQWALWYTDGGTLDDEPFGRALRLVGDADADPATDTRDHDERVFVLVEPEPAAVDFNGRWWNPDTSPRWTFTLFDVFNLKSEQ
ncbi:MAG TPA: patatin-like phospholipase family protein, partial [Acidimicrobiales bacterium]